MRKEKTTQYLYKHAINNTSRKKTYPSDNGDIVQPYRIDTLNIGVKSMENQLFIRVSFVGSNKYYELGIQYERFDFWSDYCKSFYNQKPDLDFMDTDDEEEVDEFAFVP